MRPMKVDRVVYDAKTNAPFVVLADASGTAILPIMIGPFEATSIAMALQGVEPPRPTSHDLMKTMVESMRASLTRVLINDLRDSTFLCSLQLETADGVVNLDSRPSDGIALALRLRAPIYVTDAIPLVQLPGAENKRDSLKAYVDSLKPSDFLAD